jgi:hypothetical protein
MFLRKVKTQEHLLGDCVFECEGEGKGALI